MGRSTMFFVFVVAGVGFALQCFNEFTVATVNKQFEHFCHYRLSFFYISGASRLGDLFQKALEYLLGVVVDRAIYGGNLYPVFDVPSEHGSIQDDLVGRHGTKLPFRLPTFPFSAL